MAKSGAKGSKAKLRQKSGVKRKSAVDKDYSPPGMTAKSKGKKATEKRSKADVVLPPNLAPSAVPFDSMVSRGESFITRMGGDASTISECVDFPCCDKYCNSQFNYNTIAYLRGNVVFHVLMGGKFNAEAVDNYANGLISRNKQQRGNLSLGPFPACDVFFDRVIRGTKIVPTSLATLLLAPPTPLPARNGHQDHVAEDSGMINGYFDSEDFKFFAPSPSDGPLSDDLTDNPLNLLLKSTFIAPVDEDEDREPSPEDPGMYGPGPLGPTGSAEPSDTSSAIDEKRIELVEDLLSDRDRLMTLLKEERETERECLEESCCESSCVEYISRADVRKIQMRLDNFMGNGAELGQLRVAWKNLILYKLIKTPSTFTFYTNIDGKAYCETLLERVCGIEIEALDIQMELIKSKLQTSETLLFIPPYQNGETDAGTAKKKPRNEFTAPYSFIKAEYPFESVEEEKEYTEKIKNTILSQMKSGGDQERKDAKMAYVYRKVFRGVGEKKD